ncbi:hypothetical protein [uncultured Massilia sp.]|uniref:hypothetical protein n=1 Tax=uncultured Massilia sp. TaxID=169973 RepID=UPI0025F0EF41|nr:hypothetical protein [uncultured Massilia sp.]
MLVIRNEQMASLAQSRQEQIRSRLAAAIVAAVRDCSAADAEVAALATERAGARVGLHEFEELDRLYRLLHATPLSEAESGAMQRILDDAGVADPRQRLVRAEDALAHRHRLAAAQASFVDAVRSGARHG